jgi:hypothetical protein
MTTPTTWRTSSYSGSNGDCVAVAENAGSVLVRNSNHPDRGTLSLSAHAMANFVAACAAGEWDQPA